jgi:hypothetical protein
LTEEGRRDTAAAERQQAALAEIRDRVEENNRLVAAGNAMSSRMADALRLQWLRDIGTELRSLMCKTFSLNIAIYKAVVSIQGLLPSHLERMLIQEPVILEDAIGRRHAVHLQWTNCWEGFEVMLEHHFKDIQGYRKVRNKEYVVQDHATQMDIDRSTPWTAAFLPGQRVDMSLIFRDRAVKRAGIQDTTCPKCKEISSGSSDKAIHW